MNAFFYTKNKKTIYGFIVLYMLENMRRKSCII